MADKTPNLGLNTWLETDYFDVDEINENFIKLDALSICTETGIKTASYTGGVAGSAEWYYKKYTDNTVEMSARLYYTNLKCNSGDAAPYYSGSSSISFPFKFSKVYDVQMHLASNTKGWICDTTGETVLDNISFILMNMLKEESEVYKQVFVSVKGVL